MKIIKKLWMLVAFMSFSLAAAFSAAGFLQAGFLSLPSTPPSLNYGNNLGTQPGLFNGYKGYRHHRTGFVRHEDGWWYPKEAFDNTMKGKVVHTQQPEKTALTHFPEDESSFEGKPQKVDITQLPVQTVTTAPKTKQITKTALVREEAKKTKQKKEKLSKKHTKWCGKKYRSYRTLDNSFQPTKGRRKACHSPYQ